MQNIIFLVLRRMRLPLVLLIVVYGISILGFVLIPGVDDYGQPWRMGFFHAFYFVSFMGSTIGFGEIPYVFNDAQRLWTLLTIYATVICWLFTIGSLIASFQHPALRAAMTHNAFVRRLRRFDEPFYLICGAGDTGMLLINALAAQDVNSVAIDLDENRINDLEVQNLNLFVPGLHADAREPDNLISAGLKHPQCAGVVAVTASDEVNLKIAITSKLLNPRLNVICRAENHDTEKNMDSFGTNHIINPADEFARYLSKALNAPGQYLLHEWLSSAPDAPLSEPVFPPHGRWVLCGYGRFGKALRQCLEDLDNNVTIIEADPEKTYAPAGAVIGRGTEADTLQEAEIDSAVALVAGTDHDANNLSIIMTAQDLNPKLFFIARQNRVVNTDIFIAANVDMIAQNSRIISQRILGLLNTPLTAEFLRLADEQDKEWGNALVSRIIGLVEDTVPDTWMIHIAPKHSPALFSSVDQGEPIKIKNLLQNPDNRKYQIPAIALLIRRQQKRLLLPDPDERIQLFDRILFCGGLRAKHTMERARFDPLTVHYLATGQNLPRSVFLNWWRETIGADKRTRLADNSTSK